MKVIVLEGTPEEISKAFPNIGESAPLALTSQPHASAKQSGPFVSTELARLVLRRRPLSVEQLIVLKALYNAYPETVHTSELEQKTDYTAAQFRGLMGALGRRFTHTKGHAEGSLFIIRQWDAQEGSYRYSLPDTVREAMRLEKLA